MPRVVEPYGSDLGVLECRKGQTLTVEQILTSVFDDNGDIERAVPVVGELLVDESVIAVSSSVALHGPGVYRFPFGEVTLPRQQYAIRYRLTDGSVAKFYDAAKGAHA